MCDKKVVHVQPTSLVIITIFQVSVMIVNTKNSVLNEKAAPHAVNAYQKNMVTNHQSGYKDNI